jgi:hypothetical protein
MEDIRIVRGHFKRLPSEFDTPLANRLGVLVPTVDVKLRIPGCRLYEHKAIVRIALDRLL